MLKNENNEKVGVIQLVNKLDGTDIEKKDEVFCEL